MKEFPFIVAGKKSLSQRKPIYGVGINDAYYVVQPVVDGEKFMCPVYSRWVGMLTRCLSEKFKGRNQTYTNCTVCDEWLSFSNFRSWVLDQDWVGKELDKDVLFQGNKIYSPNTCLFVSKEVNSLILKRDSTRGELMVGVCIDRFTGKYMAYSRFAGKFKNLGRFNSEIDAHNAYKEFKYALIAEVASRQDEKVKRSLLNYVIHKY
jgi:hypothetical protein